MSSWFFQSWLGRGLCIQPWGIALVLKVFQQLHLRFWHSSHQSRRFQCYTYSTACWADICVSPSSHAQAPSPSHPEVFQPGSVIHQYGIWHLACITCCFFLVRCLQFMFSDNMMLLRGLFLLHLLCEVAGSHDFIMDLIMISLKASVSTVMESSGFLFKNSYDARLLRIEKCESQKARILKQ